MNSAAAFDGVVWLAVLVGIVSAAVIVSAYIRRRFHAAGHASAPTFTMDQLRRLRDQGDLTLAEHEALKRKILSLPANASAANRSPGAV